MHGPNSHDANRGAVAAVAALSKTGKQDARPPITVLSDQAVFTGGSAIPMGTGCCDGMDSATYAERAAQTESGCACGSFGSEESVAARKYYGAESKIGHTDEWLMECDRDGCNAVLQQWSGTRLQRHGVRFLPDTSLFDRGIPGFGSGMQRGDTAPVIIGNDVFFVDPNDDGVQRIR